jgi:tRNA(fMet)-specific endonuclease VapC
VYLLDTNHCSRIVNSDPELLRAVSEHEDEIISTCAIVSGELVFMAMRSERRESNLAKVERMLERIRIYPVDDPVAEHYGRLKHALQEHFGPRDRARRKAIRIEKLGFSENDLWIAAVAQAHGLTVVSADSDFRRMAEAVSLSVESWIEPVNAGTADDPNKLDEPS